MENKYKGRARKASDEPEKVPRPTRSTGIKSNETCRGRPTSARNPGSRDPTPTTYVRGQGRSKSVAANRETRHGSKSADRRKEDRSEVEETSGCCCREHHHHRHQQQTSHGQDQTCRGTERVSTGITASMSLHRSQRSRSVVCQTLHPIEEHPRGYHESTRTVSRYGTDVNARPDRDPGSTSRGRSRSVANQTLSQKSPSTQTFVNVQVEVHVHEKPARVTPGTAIRQYPCRRVTREDQLRNSRRQIESSRRERSRSIDSTMRQKESQRNVTVEQVPQNDRHTKQYENAVDDSSLTSSSLQDESDLEGRQLAKRCGAFRRQGSPCAKARDSKRYLPTQASYIKEDVKPDPGLGTPIERPAEPQPEEPPKFRWNHTILQRRHRSQSVWGNYSRPRQTESSRVMVKERPKTAPAKQQSAGPSGDHLATLTKDLDAAGESLCFDTAIIPFPARIYGEKSSHTAIEIVTNYFPLEIDTSQGPIYQYDVSIVPRSRQHLVRDIWRRYIEENFEGRITVYDGKKNAYARGQLWSTSTHKAVVRIFDLTILKERNFEVVIREVGRIDFSIFDQESNETRRKVPEPEMTAIRVILTNDSSNRFTAVGKTFFLEANDPEAPRYDISDLLVLRLGHFLSAAFGTRPYLLFDVVLKVFYRPLSLIEVVKLFSDRFGNLDKAGLDEFLRGVRIRYALPNDPNNCRVYRVIKLVGNALRESCRSGSSTLRISEYFYRKKNCPLKRPDLPLAWAGSPHLNLYLPLEFCQIAEDQMYMGAMSETDVRDVTRVVTPDARSRQSETMNAFYRANVNNSFTSEFGLTVSSRMTRVMGRVLKPPTLQTGRVVTVSHGVWKTKSFVRPKSLTEWCILSLDKYVRRETLENFQILLRDKAQHFSMNVSEPTRIMVVGDVKLSTETLHRLFSSLKDMMLVFVVLPDKRGMYGTVKNICETREGILTQCLKSRTLLQEPRKFGTTIENLLLKVNAKLGGLNHVLESVPACLKGFAMVVGANVTHSGPGCQVPSVSAVAAACDERAAQYAVSARVQRGEIIRDMEAIMVCHLRRFHQTRGRFPEKIIVFRDGISDDKLPFVFSTELRAIKNACSCFMDCSPNVTFVAIQRKHRTRLYPASQNDETGRNRNVPPGTCIDSDIVHPSDLDYYLVSHASPQGTVRPTRYRLLYDESQLVDDDIQVLSYFLCHVHAGCSRALSYPAPTYNAHLAAVRVRSYLEARDLGPHESLESIQRKLKDVISDSHPMFFV